MNHDPLCPKQLAPQLRTSAKHLWCECDLIARVRADEQAKIAAEFAQQPFIPHTGLWLTYRQIEGLTVLMRRDERQQARQRVWGVGESHCTCGSNVRLGQHCYCDAAKPYRDAAAAAGGQVDTGEPKSSEHINLLGGDAA